MPRTVGLAGGGGAFCVADVCGTPCRALVLSARVGLGIGLGVGVELVKCHRLLQTCEIIAMIVPAARITKTNQQQQQKITQQRKQAQVL